MGRGEEGGRAGKSPGARTPPPSGESGYGEALRGPAARGRRSAAERGGARGLPSARRRPPAVAAAAAGSAPLTLRARRRGKMALEAGDMEEGQLSDSDSDMTVVPSDRPMQMAVSEERARGGRGQTPGGRGSGEGARPGWRERGRPRGCRSRRPRRRRRSSPLPGLAVSRNTRAPRSLAAPAFCELPGFCTAAPWRQIFFSAPKGGERRAETASDALMLTLAGG